jgi:putative ubiquitin-RnfH superfamily antitoxin RatB of RatAB toxin-antitoxin module
MTDPDGRQVGLEGLRIEVARAWPRRHEIVEVRLPNGATVADAVAASGLGLEDVAGYAVFGRCVDALDRLEDGDRVELLRALRIDPKDARRRRAKAK